MVQLPLEDNAGDVIGKAMRGHELGDTALGRRAGVAPEAVQAAMQFYRAIGKHPIEIRKEVPGHLANRLQAAIWREAVAPVLLKR